MFRLLMALVMTFGINKPGQIQNREQIKVAVLSAAAKYDVSPQLISAVILQESNGNQFAQRYEHAFFLRYIDTRRREELLGYVPTASPTLDTEKRNRAFSWGLMQVMGQTAREMGFGLNDLARLVDIQTNIDLGTQILARNMRAAKSDIRAALLRYNGGANVKYPDEVAARISSGEVNKILA